MFINLQQNNKIALGSEMWLLTEKKHCRFNDCICDFEQI